MATKMAEKVSFGVIFVAVILMMATLAIGGDPNWVAEAATALLLWLLPGFIVSGIVWSIAYKFQQEIKSATGWTVAAFMIYWPLRVLFWLNSG